MRVYIDGYNVTRSDPATRNLPLEEQRAALEQRLRADARALLGTGDYQIVWDASGGFGDSRSDRGHVRYTRRDTADDAIVSRVRASKGRVCVVTSDGELANRCRQAAPYGADIKPSSMLYTGSKPRARRRRRGSVRRDEGIPANANAIKAELKRLWGIED